MLCADEPPAFRALFPSFPSSLCKLIRHDSCAFLISPPPSAPGRPSYPLTHSRPTAPALLFIHVLTLQESGVSFKACGDGVMAIHELDKAAVDKCIDDSYMTLVASLSPQEIVDRSDYGVPAS